MNPKNRVLGPNGFEPFPERLMNREIERGNVPAPADAGDPTASDLEAHGTDGKRAVTKEQAIQKAAQTYFEKNKDKLKRNLTLELKDSAELGSDPVLTDPAAHDLPEHGANGKKEIAKKQLKDKLAQEELEKRIAEAKKKSEANK